MSAQDLVIILVHGTWARGFKDILFPKTPIPDADWCRPTSRICKMLGQQMQGREPRRVRIETVNWSGRNTSHAREVASHKLSEKIKNNRGAKIFILAHSHGGNITISSLKEFEDDISGVICMNTPFLSINRRPVYSLRVVLISVLLLGLIPFFILLVTKIWSFTLGLFFLTFFILIGIIGTTWEALSDFLDRLASRVNRKNDKQLSQKIEKCPVLCISNAGDEPTYFLSLLESIANLPTFLLHPLSIPLFYVFLLFAQLNHLLPEIGLIPGGGSIWLTALIYFIPLHIFLLLLSLIAGTLLRSLPLGVPVLGRHALVSSLITRIMVTPVPLNVINSEYQSVDSKPESFWSLLVHSRIYDDRQVIRTITSWIKKRELQETQTNQPKCQSPHQEPVKARK